ncbi:MAG: response regulator [SAR324 cluster bacterium]|nr:response regulator [SAR324 cluster bacterium]
MEDTEPLNILIADDNLDILDQLKSFFEEQGHFVLEAHDGDEALEIFKKKSIHAVFSALTMPKMGGLELLKELKSLMSTIPFVLLSRHSDASNILASLNLGACDFLTKPLSASDLQRSLNKVITLHGNFQFSSYCLKHSVSESRSLEIGNDFEYINRIVAFITRDLPSYEILREDDLFTMNIVLGEALKNAIFHGNLEIASELKRAQLSSFQEEAELRRNTEPYQGRKVYIAYEITQNSVKYVIRDEGTGFDHTKIPDPKDPENLFKVSGRGILLIMNFLDEVFWNERGNEITMVKYRKRKQ